jgi:hypothetical protein
MRHADDIMARRQSGHGSGRRMAIRVVHKNALRHSTINLELSAAAPALCSSFRARVVGTAESKPPGQRPRIRQTTACEVNCSPRPFTHPLKMIRWEL